MTKLAANQTRAILVQAVPSYDRESDLEFAEQTSLSNLKMMEGLLEVTPHDKELLLLTSSSFTRYTFGFIEEKIEIADAAYDFEAKERLVRRAVDFYGRGKAYALRLMAEYRKGFPGSLDKDLASLSEELKQCRREHVPALFWTAFSWGSIINLQQSEPARLAELGKVELMMERILELDENFFFGGPHLFFGTYYGTRSEMLGGDPTKAKKHLERAIELTQGKFLMSRFMLAKGYAVQTQNRELFESTLDEILSSSPDLYPEQRLANELAKRRAAHLRARVDDLFFE
jgi:hypothetical protein